MHILSSGPMCSMSRALLLWLVPLFLLVGAASAAFSYFNYARMVSTFMDEQMQQLGDAISAKQDLASLPVASDKRVHEWGTYITQFYDADGRLQASSSPQIGAALVATAGFHDVQTNGMRWRVYATPPIGADAHRVQVLQSGEFRRTLAVEKAGAAIVPVLILLPLALFILFGVAAKLSREVQDIARKAALQDENSIAELPLTRVPLEIVPLVVSFNSLLTRLRDAFANQRRFVQDAAHELRTPITAVALQLENVRADMPEGACTQSLAQLQAGVSRAQRLVDQLLKLSRQEATVPEPVALIDWQAQLHESINALIALADQRHIDLGLVVTDSAPAASLTLKCVVGDLRTVVDNLIENALRHTPEGGVVDVRLSSQAGQPVLEVIDTGPGIPPDQLERVFDRFYRVPGTASGSGSGLGLSIAQSAALRSGLRISLRNRDDRSGLIARLDMPSVATGAAPSGRPVPKSRVAEPTAIG